MVEKPALRTPNGARGFSSRCFAALEEAPMPMVVTEGADHTVRYVNPAFCRLIENAAEAVGRPFLEMVEEKDQSVALLDRVFHSGVPESHTEQEGPEPHPIFWSYTIWPVLEEGRPAGVVIQVTETGAFHEKTLAINEALLLGSLRQHELTEAADSWNAQLQGEIGERKQAEAALREAQAQLTDRAGQLQGLVSERTAELMATNGQLEAFVYSIAHDLRAPLRAMQGFSAMLLEEAGSALSAQAKDYADRISRSALFMDALLRDLLAFSRISQQRVELTPISLEALVESVIARLGEDIQEKKALVECCGPWPEVMGHEPTLTQVLFNLVSNALKFARPGVPPQIRLRTEEGMAALADKWLTASAPTAPGTGLVRVWVEDHGVGIAPAHHAEVFGLFTRLEGGKYPGTGIGLAIVQKGVERMGGRVGVVSVAGEGSRFWFEVKAATNAE